jgi:threonine dehydratase
LVRGLCNENTFMHDPFPQHRLSLANIVRSAQVIPSEFLNSPQYDCEPLSELLGCHITLKLDFTNPIRSFKGRGASFLVSEMRRCGDTRHIVCASAGNWGQAMAYACRTLHIPIVIYASVHASPHKIARMKALGAEVRLAGEDFDAAKDAAKAYAKSVEGWMVEDGYETAVSEGHGTIAMELLSRKNSYDAVAIPLGNGAMLNGMARWFKSVAPEIRVLGISSEGADAMEKSWRHQKITSRTRANTIADGIAVRVPIAEAVEDMRGLVDDVLLINDTHIVDAMRLVYRHAGLMLEPAGAVSVAAIVAHQSQFAGLKVACVLCGSNITASQFAAHVS